MRPMIAMQVIGNSMQKLVETREGSVHTGYTPKETEAMSELMKLARQAEGMIRPDMPELKKGAVIQGNAKAGSWCGALMVVDDVRQWGVEASMLIPDKGVAFIRLNHGWYDIIGQASLVP